MKRFGNFVLGAILGGLVGSAIALLLAPAKGETTRQRIHEEINSIGDEVRLAATEKRAELEAELARLRQSPPPTV